MLPAISTGLSFLGSAQSLVSGAGSTISNLIGGTADTCTGLPSDAQLAHIIASANRNEDPMRRLRERFGRSDEAKAYGELTTAIYRAPISMVGAWLRYDCGSAGRIRQSMRADVNALWSKYGATFGQAAAAATVNSEYGSAPTALQPITGGVSFGNGGITGTLNVGDPPAQQGMPMWMMIVVGVALLLAVWSVITGRAGRSVRGLD